MIKVNVEREIQELKNQLSYSKKYGFFFGAGTSCALGIPNIMILTEHVGDALVDDFQDQFNRIKEDLESTFPGRKINIEDILNHLRQIRTITGEKEDKSYLDISGASATKLDNKICKIIYSLISKAEAKADYSITKKFFAWLNLQNRDYSKEIFTSNYDLIIEKSLEEIRIPYFDGFVGSYEPFFWQESIDRFVDNSDLTKNWLRLWKIHGSLNWFWKETHSGSHEIFRVGKIPNMNDIENELVIYPSKEKYDSSKKQPFISYFDRLKNVLLNGELLFIFTGYSFSDQHINEIVFNALRQNNRLSILVFFYQDSEVEELYKIASSYLNMTVFGPSKSIVGGTLGEWELDENAENTESYWDKGKKELILGDFNQLSNFLITNSGKQENIEATISEK